MNIAIVQELEKKDIENEDVKIFGTQKWKLKELEWRYFLATVIGSRTIFEAK